MSQHNREAAERLFLASYATRNILNTVGSVDENADQDLDPMGLPECIYEPSDALKKRISDYVRWCQTQEGEDPGDLMEEIAFLAFSCLKGHDFIDNYQSYAAQYDLVVNGSTDEWMLLMIYLHLDITGRIIIVEAKNIKKPVSVEQFSRFCSIVQNQFVSYCHLGVFFTRFGASGFPINRRRHSLSQARAIQLLFHAITKDKCVVVLDHNDILQLGNRGSLPRILEEKIRQVETATGLPSLYEGAMQKIALRPHLRKYTTISEPE